jgi:hypothetical protein
MGIVSTIFISHSSNDKEFAIRLAADLMKIGHKVWLDEIDIMVGDSITSKIEDGLEDCDFMVLVLSEESNKSNWVEREWKVKYWDEMQNNTTLILPIIIDNCEIPKLLRDKKYADFREDYQNGLELLRKRLSFDLSKEKCNSFEKKEIIEIFEDDTSEDIAQLLISAISQGHCSVNITYNYDISPFQVPGALGLIRDAILRTRKLVVCCDSNLVKLNISTIHQADVSTYFNDHPLPKGFEL